MRVLGKIRVRETNGIRRFLYPLSLEIPAILPQRETGSKGILAACAPISLIMDNGRHVPVQVMPGTADSDLRWRLDFAVSLSPLEEVELKLVPEHSGGTAVDDPLETVAHVPTGEEEPFFRSVQRRFSTVYDGIGTLHEAVYDSAPHLKAPAGYSRNGVRAALKGISAFAAGYPLGAFVKAAGEYPDGCGAVAQLETTACKSWVMLTHTLSRTDPEDELVFNLPLWVSSPVLTCDFGVGGGIYSSLQADACPEVVWKSEFLIREGVRWSITSAGRTDHIGKVPSAEEYLGQRWFHLIDGHKAVAVAITRVPASCREMKVTLRADGDVAVAFRMGEPIDVPWDFGICCHFLNNIPPIAAATNPQSILTPPVATLAAVPPTGLA